MCSLYLIIFIKCYVILRIVLRNCGTKVGIGLSPDPRASRSGSGFARLPRAMDNIASGGHNPSPYSFLLRCKVRRGNLEHGVT